MWGDIFNQIVVAKKRREPRVCAKKYLITASYDLLLGDFKANGMKAKRLSSMPM